MSTFPGKSVHRWIPSRTIHLPPVQLEDVRVYQHRRGYGQDEVRGGCSCCTKRATDVATFTQCPRNIAPRWHKDITVTAKNLAPDRIWRHKKDTMGPRQNLILSKIKPAMLEMSPGTKWRLFARGRNHSLHCTEIPSELLIHAMLILTIACFMYSFSITNFPNINQHRESGRRCGWPA